MGLICCGVIAFAFFTSEDKKKAFRRDDNYYDFNCKFESNNAKEKDLLEKIKNWFTGVKFGG